MFLVKLRELQGTHYLEQAASIAPAIERGRTLAYLAGTRQVKGNSLAVVSQFVIIETGSPGSRDAGLCATF